MSPPSRQYRNKARSSKEDHHVGFTEDLHTVIKFEPYSFELGFSIWYNPEEEQEFKDRNTELLMSMSKMSPTEMEEKLGETTRGLESKVMENAQIADERIKRSIAAVKAMQMLQRKQLANKKALRNPDALANAYASSAESARLDAQRLAELDAAYVTEHIRPDDYIPMKIPDRPIPGGKLKRTDAANTRHRRPGRNGSIEGMMRKLGKSSRRMITRAFSNRDLGPSSSSPPTEDNKTSSSSSSSKRNLFSNKATKGSSFRNLFTMSSFSKRNLFSMDENDADATNGTAAETTTTISTTKPNRRMRSAPIAAPLRSE